jgi:hypothetical protein
MTSALVGLLGVIAGGLLGGAVSYRVERRKRRDDATVAGRLIVLELEAAAVRLRKSGEAGKPWPGKLQDKRWQDHAGELLGFLPRERRKRTVQETEPAVEPSSPPLEEAPGDGSTGTVGSAQAPGSVSLAEKLLEAYSLIDVWNAAAALSPAGEPVGDKKELKDDALRLERVGKELTAWLSRPRPQRVLGRFAAVALGTLALLAAGGALIVERPHATAQTVAAAIAAGLSGRQTVQCLDQPGDAWDCTAQTVVDARSACGASLRLPPEQASTRRLAGAPARCRPHGQPQRYEAVLRGDDVVAIPVASSAHSELEGRRATLDIPVDQERWYHVVIDAILGR